jgi:hypothetical protein
LESQSPNSPFTLVVNNFTDWYQQEIDLYLGLDIPPQTAVAD